MSKINIPDEVLNGFAEYGANYFALYDYSDRKYNTSIHCITESPFSMSFNLNWVDTAKASLLKKMAEITGKVADVAQILGKNDYTIVQTGESTYVKYNGMERQSYNAQIVVLNQGYTTNRAIGKLSSARDIESFLKANALPLVGTDVISQLVNNFFQAPVDVVDNVVGTIGKIRGFNINVENFKQSTIDTVVGCMDDARNSIAKLFMRYKDELQKELQEAVVDFILAEKEADHEVKIAISGWFDVNFNKKKEDEIRDFIKKKVTIDFEEKGDGNTVKRADTYRIQVEFPHTSTFDKDLVTAKVYGEKVTDDFKNKGANVSYALKAFYDNDWSNMKGSFTIKKDILNKLLSLYDFRVNEAEEFDKRNWNYSKVLDVLENMKSEYDNIVDDSCKKIEGIFKVSNQQAVTESKSAFDHVVDSLINVQKEYGDFNHRITPCVLFFSFGGLIFSEHVLITNWSKNENVWGFNTNFDITMEKAEVQSWQTYESEIIHFPGENDA